MGAVEVDVLEVPRDGRRVAVAASVAVVLVLTGALALTVAWLPSAAAVCLAVACIAARHAILEWRSKATAPALSCGRLRLAASTERGPKRSSDVEVEVGSTVACTALEPGPMPIDERVWGIGLAAAAADGAIPVGELLTKWASVDTSFFNAIEQLTHESVSSIADVHRAIEGWNAIDPWSGPSSHLVDKVKGHVAEWMLKGNLEAAGHHVEMPDASNQAAWDMKVDGEAFQVKAGVASAARSAKEHLLENADVGVILPHDAVGIPDHATHFDSSLGEVDFGDHAGGLLVDDALSGSAAETMTENGLDAAAGHIDLHIPWITIGFSTFREGKLLLDGCTDLSRVIKNVAVDGVGVGVGGLAGAKGGALVGALFGPVGAVIGGLVGGIAGSIGGKAVATEIRRAPLLEAKKKFDDAIGSFNAQRERAVADAEKDWRVTEARVTDALRREVGALEKEVVAATQAERNKLDGLRWLPHEDVARGLAVADAELEQTVQQARTAAAVPLWRRIIWPRPRDISARRRAQAMEREVNSWRARRAQLLLGHRASLDAVASLAVVTPSGLGFVEATLRTLERERARAIRVVEHAAMRARAAAIKKRATALRALERARASLTEKVTRDIERAAAPLADARDVLVDEMRRAGITVPDQPRALLPEKAES